MIPILNVDLTQLVSNMVLVQYTIKTNIGTLASNASNMLRLVQGEGVDRIVLFRFKKKLIRLNFESQNAFIWRIIDMEHGTAIFYNLFTLVKWRSIL